jgi:prepilin-type N-terminal cleavage/methylation domain-containing protein
MKKQEKSDENTMRMGKSQKGFSLIELLIVVAIILIIAAIAIPNIVRAKMSANEASAVGSLRAINTGEVLYLTTYDTFATQDQLGPGDQTCSNGATPDNACLIDFLLASATAPATAKSGYYFLVTATPTTYTSEAEPADPTSTGTRGFCSDQDMTIYFVAMGGAMGTCTTANGTPL